MNPSSQISAEQPPSEASDLARSAARAADSKGATEIVILDVAPVMGICELFVILTAANTPMVKAVTDEIQERISVDCNRRPRAIEGADARHWVLLDYGDIVVHVFLAEDREYYRLERLYADSVQQDWQAGTPTT
jgi:ribosome-associated protein